MYKFLFIKNHAIRKYRLRYKKKSEDLYWWVCLMLYFFYYDSALGNRQNDILVSQAGDNDGGRGNFDDGVVGDDTEDDIKSKDDTNGEEVITINPDNNDDEEEKDEEDQDEEYQDYSELLPPPSPVDIDSLERYVDLVVLENNIANNNQQEDKVIKTINIPQDYFIEDINGTLYRYYQELYQTTLIVPDDEADAGGKYITNMVVLYDDIASLVEAGETITIGKDGYVIVDSNQDLSALTNVVEVEDEGVIVYILPPNFFNGDLYASAPAYIIKDIVFQLDDNYYKLDDNAMLSLIPNDSILPVIDFFIP